MSEVELVEVTSTTFGAMGTTVEVIVVNGRDDDLSWAARRLIDHERRWSRFISTSDVSKVNRARGRWAEVEPQTLDLVERAIAATSATGGAFDPTLGEQLARAGYDRSFDELDRERCGLRWVPPLSAAVEPLEVDRTRSRVRVAGDRALDFGGIAKGWVADGLVQELLEDRLAEGACVNVGGDLAVGGRPPDPRGWCVDVVHGYVALAPIVVRGGGIATSTTTRRRWHGPDGDERHHLLDPRTGRPTSSEWRHVTVVGPSATDAEVLTKVAFASAARLGEALATANAWAIVTDRVGHTETLGRGSERDGAVEW